MTKTMTSSDYDLWTNYKANYSTRPSDKQIDLIVDLHAKYFNHHKYYHCTCNPKTWNQWIAQLNNIYESTNNA